MKLKTNPSLRRAHLLAAGVCVALSTFGATASHAELVAKTYPPTACSPSSVTQATTRLWSKDIRGIRNDSIRSSLIVECPVLKDQVRAPLSRAFVWVQDDNRASSVRCTLRSTRIDGVSRVFFTGVSSTGREDSEQLEFRVERVPDQSFPTSGDVIAPSAYSIGCTLPNRRGGRTALLGYHVEEDG